MVTLSFTIFSGQKNYNRAHMLFQVLCGFEPIFYTTHPNEESFISMFKECIEDLNKLGRFDLSLLWTKSMDTYLNLPNANSKYK